MCNLLEMPELPEVETVVRQLRQRILNKKVDLVEVFEPSVVDDQLQHEKPFSFKGVKRRGKSIIMSLDSGKYILTHLRMTGHFHYVPKKSTETLHKNYLAAVFHFKKGDFMTHNSIRKFGSMSLVNKEDLAKLESSLGPEPLGLSSEDFMQQLKQFPNSVIKSKLLDQKCIAGIGNIYAQEALYHSGINPTKKINQITNKKLSELNDELQRILLLSIKNNGSTVSNYSSITGKGNFQNFLAVYNQETCPKNHSLRKINIGGRGTYFCQSCQR